MKIFCHTILFTILTSIAMHAAAKGIKTLCDSAEETYLSCVIGKKLLSVCGSKPLTKEVGYLRYIFGTAKQKAEIIYPSEKIHPSQAFRRNEPLTAAKAGVMALAFDIDGFTYNVFSTRSAFGYNGAGVIVQQGEKQVASKQCAARMINDDKFFFDLAHVGIPVGAVRYIGPEQ